MKSTKPPLCKFCRKRLPAFGRVLHDECTDPWIQAHQVKQMKRRQAMERKTFRARKEKAKTPTEWKDECQAIINRIACLRDRHEGCISCDKPANWQGRWNGSHFRSVKAASAIRFNLWNIHRACWVCNQLYSGNVAEYTPRLIEKIGSDRVEWLQSQTQTRSYSVDYCKKFKRVMGKRLRRMEKRL